MTALRQPMLAALPRSGKSARTPASAVRAVRLLAQCSHTSPDRLSAPKLQRSFLHRTNVDGVAPAAMRLCSRGLRFFAPHGLQRDGHTRSRLRAPTTHRLPAVLSVEEGKRLLAAATPWHHQGSFPTVYRVGRRLHAARFLQVADSAGPRLQGHVHRGKGAKDRSVPCPADPRTLLRPSWNTPRHTPWRFPATGRAHAHRPPATSPRRRARGQGAFRTTTHRAGLPTLGVAIHPLRHASATPLLEAGGNPRRIPRSLGHTQRDTTRRSLPLTHTGHADASARLNALRHGLLPCPPSARAAPPVRPSPWSAPPSCPSPTARSSVPSNTAPAATTATASRSAPPVGTTTACTMPVATASVPSASSRHPRSGSSTPATPSSRGRTA
jgi:integrase/recombinase XerD